MGDRGRLGRSSDGNDRNQSPRRSGDRGQSSEQGDHAESSYNRGHQEVAQQPESSVQHLWMTAEEPDSSAHGSEIEAMNESQIKETINGCSFKSMMKAALEALGQCEDDEKRDVSYRPAVFDTLDLKDANNSDQFAAKLHSMLNSHENDEIGEWAAPRWAATEMIDNAIFQKWQQNHPSSDRGNPS